MTKRFSTFNDVKKLTDEFKKKDARLLDNDGNKIIDITRTLKEKYDVTSYYLAFENDSEAVYFSENKKIVTRSGISHKKVRLYVAICLAYNIFAEASGEKPSSFVYKKGDAIYNNTKEKIIFDIATELLIANDSFYDVAIQHRLDVKKLADFYDTTQAVVLNKLNNYNLLR